MYMNHLLNELEPAMEYSLQVMGMTIYYLDSSPQSGEDKQALLFFHGWGASKETFLPVFKEIGDKYRIIAPDLPGFGKTGEPDRPWSVSDYGTFIRSLVEGLGLADTSFSVCGHSHGGRILIKWAATGAAKRLQRMILIDSAGLRRKRSLLWHARVNAYKAGKKFLETPGLRRLLAPLAARASQKAASEDYRQASPLMRKTMTLLLEEDLCGFLPLIKVPTLLFWGEQDEDTPIEMGRRMEREIPGAGLVVLSPAGHYSYLDQMSIFVKALTYFMEH